ncbi:MAG: tRNA (adenosine(37)-N6)-threonylcarbamoyltransferase complex ATPase subunit type 1 TsaE [Bryobacteraceae bacterium]
MALGARIARELPARGVVLLIGNLGAGKTMLAKGIVSGLEAAPPEEVSSPTFTLIHEYGGGAGASACQPPFAPVSPSTPGVPPRAARVYHIDLYRLEEAREAATLGLDEIFERDAIVLIEWGERFPQLMPAARTEIRLRDLGGDEREIEVTTLP